MSNIIEYEEANNDIKPYKIENKGFVKLPVCEADFEEFICGLLGEPQSIEGSFVGEYEIDLKTVENLHHLLQQRIKQQNRNKLIQFRSKIVYDNNSSITLNSFEELQTYNEIKAVVPVALNLTWVYLVKFEDKNVLEKQVINVSFRVGAHMIKKDFKIPIYYDKTYIEFEIAHTARSWGVDIEFLLSNYLKSLIKEKSKVKKYFVDHQALIGLVTGLFVYATSILGSIFASTKFTQNTTSLVLKELQKNDDVSSKINVVANYIANGDWTKFSNYNNLFLIIMVAVAVMLGIWVGDSLDIQERSYILLNDEAAKDKIRVEKKLKKKWRSSIISILSSIVCSVIASYIYYYLNV